MNVQRPTGPISASVSNAVSAAERAPWQTPSIRALHASLSESGLNNTTDSVEGTS
jgi:hypothetical protein